MESLNPRGYTAVLRNRYFLRLWIAQVFSNTALNGSFFLQLILIDQVTGSSAQLAAVILAFSLPAVLLSALAGVVVDRVPKKTILVASNALRVLTGAALAFLAAYLLTNQLTENLFLIAIYTLVFAASAIGQFFAPAEGATIPLLVRTDNLLPANSLFTLTFTASQILGLVILAPLGVKTIGIAGSLWAATAMYLAATILVALIPRDQPQRAQSLNGLSAVRGAWNEIHEGWRFAISHRAILISLLQLALVSGLTMILAELAPGFATRVLGLRPEDATYVFWPAGVGILIASILIGRYGQSVPREVLASAGMFGMGLAMAGLAWTTSERRPFDQPLLVGHPESVLTTAAMVMFFALIVGVTIAMINIPAQTIVQERSHDAVRGRVLAVQFTLANALGIPPMLFVGGLADILGIPRVTLAIGVMIMLLAVLNFAVIRSMSHLPARHRHSANDEPALGAHSSDSNVPPAPP
ncbi:MAG: MFS transporter [Chloroflexota bacterium]|nr:MFS transporter [Chloroflexota bacterium]